VGLFIAHCRFPIANWLLTTQAIGIRHLAIGNVTAHPLPRGGTDLIGTERCSKGQELKLHQYFLAGIGLV
jgi:hypothetical protein